MATGRTVSASFLTEKDKKILGLCSDLVRIALDRLGAEAKKEFQKEFGKISETRDAGVGRGAGKLQRDALCTRGITSKGPFSNRNFRWHPLVVSNSEVPYARTVKRIEIEGEDEAQTLVFIIDENGEERRYRSDEIWSLSERYTAPTALWMPHIERIKYWTDNLWTQNSCAIASYEACDWFNAVEAFATLLLSVVCDGPYNLDYRTIWISIKERLERQDIDEEISLPSEKFPSIRDRDDVINCPLCLRPHSASAAGQEQRERPGRFNLPISSSKRGEGDDNSMQIMHVSPLIETELRHNARNVRFGHRWCNVAMTDHSIDETLDFMKAIIEARED